MNGGIWSRRMFAIGSGHLASDQNAENARAHMNLLGIEPEKPGYELHTFVCPQCSHIETAVGKSA